MWAAPGTRESHVCLHAKNTVSFFGSSKGFVGDSTASFLSSPAFTLGPTLRLGAESFYSALQFPSKDSQQRRRLKEHRICTFAERWTVKRVLTRKLLPYKGAKSVE